MQAHFAVDDMCVVVLKVLFPQYVVSWTMLVIFIAWPK